MTYFKVTDPLTGFHLGNFTAETPEYAARSAALANGWTLSQWEELIVVPYCPTPCFDQLTEDEHGHRMP